VNISSASDQDIVRAINNESIDDENLVGRDTWRTICKVRGRNFNAVDVEAWQSLCARRGYVLSRRNPRGF
jgi:hypothetical protein